MGRPPFCVGAGPQPFGADLLRNLDLVHDLDGISVRIDGLELVPVVEIRPPSHVEPGLVVLSGQPAGVPVRVGCCTLWALISASVGGGPQPFRAGLGDGLLGFGLRYRTASM